jgi:dTMP kinase
VSSWNNQSTYPPELLQARTNGAVKKFSVRRCEARFWRAEAISSSSKSRELRLLHPATGGVRNDGSVVFQQGLVVKMKKKGLLITFEGIDGCGKSVQARRSLRFLQNRGHDVILMREPGSTPVAERLRRILLDKKLFIPDVTELLLYEAARSELVDKIIRPALRQGKIVLLDRFYDSTTAYQGYGRELDINMVRSLHKIATGGIVPDLTMVFNVDLKTGFARRSKDPDRLESQAVVFHERVQRGFLEIARKERGRVKVIDGAQSIGQVFKEVRKLLEQKLNLR